MNTKKLKDKIAFYLIDLVYFIDLEFMKHPKKRNFPVGEWADDILKIVKKYEKK